MIKLDARNVLLKPSQRRQIMNWLRRSLRLGTRLGGFVLTITLQRIGRLYEVRASVHDRAGDFGCRSRSRDLRSACRDLAKTLAGRLHDQNLRQRELAT